MVTTSRSWLITFIPGRTSGKAIRPLGRTNSINSSCACRSSTNGRDEVLLKDGNATAITAASADCDRADAARHLCLERNRRQSGVRVGLAYRRLQKQRRNHVHRLAELFPDPVFRWPRRGVVLARPQAIAGLEFSRRRLG